MMLRAMVLTAMLGLGFGCSSAPEKPDKQPTTVAQEDSNTPSAAKLAECPCGEADWSEPPPGAPAQDPGTLPAEEQSE